nr:hypothetical protein [uncultured Flavobacterium sp.]
MSLKEIVVETIKSNDLQSVTKDLAEVAFDGLLTDGLIKDIPFLGAIFGIGKGIMSISDCLFTKKLILFIYELKEMTIEERNHQISKIQRDSNYQDSIGEKLLMIIDKCSDSKKATWIGKLFLHCLKNEISYRDFIRCSEIINNASLYSLNEIIGQDYTGIPIDQEDDLISSGLFRLEPPKIELIKSENTHQHFRDGEELRTSYKVKDVEWSALLSRHGEIIRKYLRNSC